MKILKNLVLTGLALFSGVVSSFAQDTYYKDYDWEPNPKISNVVQKDTSEKEIVILDKSSKEYFMEEVQGYNREYEYYLVHRRIKVMSDEAIEKNNKVYVPSYYESKVLKLKARLIHANGKVVEMDEDDIIEANDEKTGSTYKYFAMEGVQKGDEIEYLFYIRRNNGYFGLRGRVLYLQEELPIRHMEFDLIVPDIITLKTKSINNLPAMRTDSSVNDRVRYFVTVDNVSAFEAEEYAIKDPMKMGVVYKWGEYKPTERKNIVNYSDIAAEEFDGIMGTTGSNAKFGYNKSKSAVAKMLKALKLMPEDDEKTKVQKLEYFIKKNTSMALDFSMFGFSFELKPQPWSKRIATALDKDSTTKMYLSVDEMITLFVFSLHNMGIEYNLVFTTNRFESRFDKDFEAQCYVQECLIYLPQLKMYIDPTDLDVRGEFFNHGFYNNYGLFVIPVNTGGINTAIAKVNFIQPLSEKKTTDSLVLNCALTSDFSKLSINYRRTQRGWYAVGVQAAYDKLDKEDKASFEERFTTFLTDNPNEVNSQTIENSGTNSIGKPFISGATLEVAKFVEVAEKKYLIKLGELIGPQTELYQKKDRRLPVENPYNHLYYRRINFTVPAGYKIAPESLTKLKMDVEHKVGSDVACKFTSDYKLNGSELVVDCTEYYAKIDMPLDQFEGFRKVINAAADFNKITLVLEKQ